MKSQPFFTVIRFTYLIFAPRIRKHCSKINIYTPFCHLPLSLSRTEWCIALSTLLCSVRKRARAFNLLISVLHDVLFMQISRIVYAGFIKISIREVLKLICNRFMLHICPPPANSAVWITHLTYYRIFCNHYYYYYIFLSWQDYSCVGYLILVHTYARWRQLEKAVIIEAILSFCPNSLTKIFMKIGAIKIVQYSD